ncbi:hypothetical protein NA57DRAFT_75971 [Rhizodiscina lignyota]|uniref:Heterokaryon incompatibility domain-containing protein n=1 Tax=Rhizodiscina lignyota TaxID=1504668 RepID=A0A9P4IHU6_9PEZI|nr:hypothetical protein NA57DRAFT_75971 [Rhizodiscina lignyota]
MDPPLPAYVYHPLRKERAEIRLLELQPAPDLHHPLRGTVRHKALSDAKFSALSYTWGDQKEHRSDIEITYKHGKLASALGKIFHSKAQREAESTVYRKDIGNSLAAAFRHLRQKDRPVTVWADALCINQDDEKEKSWQVSLMTRIYSTSIMVHTWLGPRYNESPTVVDEISSAFAFIRSVERQVHASSKWSLLAHDSLWLNACFALAQSKVWHHQEHDDEIERLCAGFAVEMRSSLLSEGSSKRYLGALRLLSQIEYFSRVWIIQEAGKARDLTFHYGKQRASHKFVFLSLCLAKGFLASRSSLESRELSKGFDSRFYSCLTARRPMPFTTVLQLVYLSRSAMQQATNQRDLIYGLIGLAEGRVAIEIDYSLSVEQVYTSTAQMLLREGFTDLLIAFKPYSPPHAFPSWTYDWSTRGASAFDKFQACGNTKQQISFVQLPGSQPKQAMRLGGSSVGRITATGRRFSTLAHEAGLSAQMIWSGTRYDEHALSAQEQERLRAEIVREQRRHHNDETTADAGDLFSDVTFPEASFWLWWTKWVLALGNFFEGTTHQEADSDVSEDVFELLLRIDPARGRADPSIPRSAGRAKNFPGLTDIRTWIDAKSGDQTRNPTTASAIEGILRPYRWAWGMRPVILDTGYIGYAPENTEVDDEIVVFSRVKAPLVIRKVDRQAHKIIGPAYVSRVMQGQFLRTIPGDQTFTLV